MVTIKTEMEKAIDWALWTKSKNNLAATENVTHSYNKNMKDQNAKPSTKPETDNTTEGHDPLFSYRSILHAVRSNARELCRRLHALHSHREALPSDLNKEVNKSLYLAMGCLRNCSNYILWAQAQHKEISDAMKECQGPKPGYEDFNGEVSPFPTALNQLKALATELGYDLRRNSAGFYTMEPNGPGCVIQGPLRSLLPHLINKVKALKNDATVAEVKGCGTKPCVEDVFKANMLDEKIDGPCTHLFQLRSEASKLGLLIFDTPTGYELVHRSGEPCSDSFSGRDAFTNLQYRILFLKGEKQRQEDAEKKQQQTEYDTMVKIRKQVERFATGGFSDKVAALEEICELKSVGFVYQGSPAYHFVPSNKPAFGTNNLGYALELICKEEPYSLEVCLSQTRPSTVSNESNEVGIGAQTTTPGAAPFVQPPRAFSPLNESL